MIAKWMAQAMNSAELESHGVRYAWVVTEEYNSWDYDPGKWIQIEEVAGPSTATEEEIERARKGQPFQLDYDGSDGPCCRGRIWCSDARRAQESEAAMAPLDDYGEGNYGATTLKYRDSNGKWEVM